MSAPADDHTASELIQIEAGPRSGIGRRAVLQSLVTGVGAGVALPHLAAAHPMHDHLADQKKVTAADKKAAAPAYKPEFLDAHQYATLVSIAERIVPGSTKARVAPFVDQLLAADSSDNQRRFLGSMGAVEMQAVDTFGKPWTSLSAAQQDELLTAASTGSSGLKTIGGDPRGHNGGRTEGKATSYDHFINLRSWIAGAYYSSEIGMRELGWTGEMFFTELPGCTHEGGHG